LTSPRPYSPLSPPIPSPACFMPPDQPSQATSGPALVDRLVYSLKAALPAWGYGGWVTMRRRLWDLGVVQTLPQSVPAAAETLKIKCTLTGLSGGAEVDLFGELRVTYDASTEFPVILTSKSKLGFNPQKALASILPRNSLPVCLDGRQNAVGDQSALPFDFFELQYTIAAEAIDRFIDLLGEAAGAELPRDREEEGIWLQYVEVCRDIAVPDAIGVVESLRDSSLHGAGQAMCKRVNAKGDLRHLGAFRVLTWHEPLENAPAHLKIYPKARNLVRTEVVYHKREVLLRELEKAGRHSPWAPFHGTQAAELLRPIVAIAQHDLDVGAAHIAGGRQPQGDQLTFLAGLTPLLRIITPPTGKIGAKSRAETVDLAYSVIRSLLLTGMYNTKGLDSKSLVREALYEMAKNPNGIVNRGGSRESMFSVKPNFELARSAFRESLFASFATNSVAPSIVEAPEATTGDDLNELEVEENELT